jgi:hypothetical protein
MLYMFLAASSPAARASGMSGGPRSATVALSHPTLAFAFAVALVGYGIWDLDQLSGRRYATGTRVSLAGADGVGGVGAVGMPVLVGAQSRPALRAGTMPCDTDPDADRGMLDADLAARDAGQAARARGEHAVSPSAGGHAARRARDEHAAASRGGTACADGPHPGGGGFLLSPAVTVGCRITMSIVMAFMLLMAL